MCKRIEDTDVWLFRELYFVLATLADEPQNTIQRIGKGRISVPDDQANDLEHFRRCILEKYPWSADRMVIRTATAIDAILSRHNRSSRESEDWFWTNAGFLRHDDWATIRELPRELLVR